MFELHKWTSDFLGTSYRTLSLSTADARDIELALLSTHQLGAGIYELRLPGTLIDHAPTLNEFGFALVDGRLEFRTLVESPKVEPRPPEGGFRRYHPSDYSAVQELTYEAFASNRDFKSRFNNRNFFSERVSHRYYMAWIDRAIHDSPDLFGVWDHGSVGAYYNILRVAQPRSAVFKVGLAAVSANSPLRGLQNSLQNWIYWQAAESAFEVINSPALSNYPGIKNNIRASRKLAYTELIFYKVVDTILPIDRVNA